MVAPPRLHGILGLEYIVATKVCYVGVIWFDFHVLQLLPCRFTLWNLYVPLTIVWWSISRNRSPLLNSYDHWKVFVCRFFNLIRMPSQKCSLSSVEWFIRIKGAVMYLLNMHLRRREGGIEAMDTHHLTFYCLRLHSNEIGTFNTNIDVEGNPSHCYQHIL